MSASPSVSFILPCENLRKSSKSVTNCVIICECCLMRRNL